MKDGESFRRRAKVTISTAFFYDQLSIIDKEAKVTGVTRAEALRQLVDKWIKQKGLK
jgi:hypothetical protein